MNCTKVTFVHRTQLKAAILSARQRIKWIALPRLVAELALHPEFSGDF